MKKIKALSIVLTATIALSPPAYTSVAVADNNPSRHQYVILTRDSEATKEAINSGAVEEIIFQNSVNDMLITNLTVAEAEEISAETEVIAVEENIVFSADTEETEENLPTDETQPLWNIQMINAEGIDASAEEKVRVGVMDSGVNGSTVLDVKYYQDYIDEDSFMFPDLSGHGTAVAGVIASQEYGINPNAELYSIKVLNENNQGELADVINGIYWAIENEIKILNMSFGTSTYSEALEIAINDAINSGILIIASSGNDGAVRYPAAFEGVISVGSIDHSGDVAVEAETFSPLIYAPGEHIFSIGDFETTTVESGTSMAAPHVTAVAATILGRDLSKSADFVKQLILSTANVSTGKLIVDANMALENYNTFAENYIENANQIPEILNTTELTVFDDATFEALWQVGTHQSMPDSILSGFQFTSKQKKVLKYFSRIPDNTDVTFQSLRSSSGITTGFDVTYKNYLTGTKFRYSNGDWFYIANKTEVDFRENRLLHGGQNYVASLKYLLTVAENLWHIDYYEDTSLTNRDIIYEALLDVEYDMANTSVFYKDTANYGNIVPNTTTIDATSEYPGEKWFVINNVTHADLCSASEQKFKLQELVYLAANCKAVDSSHDMTGDFTGKELFQKEAAIKVLGMALHLVGDIYAHRTIIPSVGMPGAVKFSTGAQPETLSGEAANTIYRGSTTGKDFYGKGLWTGYEGIKKTILGDGNSRGGAKITTRQIHSVWQDEQSNEGSYEDNPNFLPGRYNFTKLTTKMCLEIFLDNAVFTTDVFKISIEDSDNEYIKIQRLGDLRRFVKYTEGSISSTYLQYYDSKTTMSDVVTLNGDTEVALQGPTSTTDPNWYTRGVQLSY